MLSFSTEAVLFLKAKMFSLIFMVFRFCKIPELSRAFTLNRNLKKNQLKVILRTLVYLSNNIVNRRD